MVTVNELLQTLPDIAIYAGQSGLGKPVNTISFIDAPSSVDWLNGGEIILTTAFLYKENTEMQYRFVKKLIEMDVAALGIKIGRYIEQVPDSIITLADTNHFPIFGISFDTVWSEIFTAFYNLSLDKPDRRSILSTEIITFDKLFRSSAWDSELIRSYFLKCVGVPAAIVNESYEILSKNNGGSAIDAIDAYCKKRVKYHKNTEAPTLFIAHAREMCKIFDLSLYEGERMILCSGGSDILENELDWIKTLYESIRKKNRFMQDTPGLWKNFVQECLINAVEDNLMDYIRVLKLKEEQTSVILIFSGDQAADGADRFRRQLREHNTWQGGEVHKAVMDDGNIIMLYTKPAEDGIFAFVNDLRVILQKAARFLSGCRIWVGEPVTKPQEIGSSYSNAVMARKMGTLLLPEEPLVFYRDISIVARLNDGDYDFSEIIYLYENIQTFDACKTLEVFLESGNIKRAAESSFIHGNTMRYRVQKMEQLLNLDLSKPVNRLNLLIKLKLWRIATMEKPEGKPSVSK